MEHNPFFLLYYTWKDYSSKCTAFIKFCWDHSFGTKWHYRYSEQDGRYRVNKWNHEEVEYWSYPLSVVWNKDDTGSITDEPEGPGFWSKYPPDNLVIKE